MNLKPLCPDCREPMEPLRNEALTFSCPRIWEDFGLTARGETVRLPGARHRVLRVWREGELTVWTTKGAPQSG